MGELNQADRYLLAEIRRGSQEGWARLVDRYQGRLLAFARGRLSDRSEAEDLVQETFLGFLKGLDRYQEAASVETYLFAILRRKIADWQRGKPVNLCSLQDLIPSRDATGPPDAAAQIPGREPTASWYLRRHEEDQRRESALADALRRSIDHFKKSLNLRDLQIIEMIFYCRLRNKDVAETVGVTEKQVALVKHRFIKQVRHGLADPAPDSVEQSPPDTLLSQIWQQQRLSCLKRSTIGAYLLDTLEPDWRRYVEFHLHQLGCACCQANLDDLNQQRRQAEHRRVFRDRIMQSTVGFLPR